jgi:carbon monoxide dehydrogenase subunit G
VAAAIDVMKTEVSVEIDAPPDTALAVITDIPRWPDVMRGVERVALLEPGAPRVGTRFRVTRTMFGRSASEDMTVAELSPRLVLTAENHGTRYVVTHAVEPAARGSRLVLTFEGVPVSLAARLFSVIGLLFMGALRRQLAADLADLKAEAERRAELPAA